MCCGIIRLFSSSERLAIICFMKIMKRIGTKFSTSLALLAIVTFLPIQANAQQDGKFPYRGQWDQKVTLASGKPLVVSYTFNNKAQCVLTVIYGKSKTSWSCSYLMQGKSALVSYTRYGTTTHGERRRYVQRLRLTPLNNGAKLLCKEIDLSYQVIGKGSQWHTRKQKAEFQLTRVHKG